jgi:hypothetical protein
LNFSLDSSPRPGCARLPCVLSPACGSFRSLRLLQFVFGFLRLSTLLGAVFFSLRLVSHYVVEGLHWCVPASCSSQSVNLNFFFLESFVYSAVEMDFSLVAAVGTVRASSACTVEGRLTICSFPIESTDLVAGTRQYGWHDG